MNKYQTFRIDDTITCDLISGLPKTFTAYVMKPCPPFVFGELMAAFVSYEDAVAVAGALNAAEELLAKLERLASK